MRLQHTAHAQQRSCTIHSQFLLSTYVQLKHVKKRTYWRGAHKDTMGAFHLGKKNRNFGGSKSGISDW